MRVRWLRNALRNLDDEASYIAADDPAAARLVVKRVLTAVAMLAEQPGLGRPGRVLNRCIGDSHSARGWHRAQPRRLLAKDGYEAAIQLVMSACK